MTPEKEAMIRALAGRVHDASTAYRASQLMNVPTDPEKAREQAIRHELARAQWIEAWDDLKRAMRSNGESVQSITENTTSTGG